MLPLWNGEGQASPKFGNIAIEKLISKMTELGSEKKNLQAKIFGGAEVLEQYREEGFKIGELNLKIAEERLKKEKIAISAHSVGGKKGRKVIFYTDTGQVLMKFIDHGFPNVQVPH
jgi:chemotaxis protein CheD